MAKKMVIAINSVFLFFLIFGPILSQYAYYFNLLTLIFFYTSLSEAWNIIGGFGNQLFLGTPALLATGGYTAMFLAKHSLMHPLLGIWVGGLCAMVLALITAFSLKLRGDFFAIATLCLSPTLYTIVWNTEELGGVNGISIAPDPMYNRTLFYYIFIITSIILFLVSYIIRTSNFGLKLLALGDNEDLARATGINTFIIKLKTYLISAFFIGVLGGLYAYFNLCVTPAHIFDLTWALRVVLICTLGGIGSLPGPIIGSFIYTMLEYYILSLLGTIYRIVAGSLIILIVLLRFRSSTIISHLKALAEKMR